MFDFSDLKPKTFQYQERYYRICYDIRGIGWFINRYNSLWDYSRPWGAPEQCLGEYFTNPFDLLRTVKVDGLSIEEIINILPESDPTQWPIYDYNYERFLIDISHKMEFSFSFRGSRGKKFHGNNGLLVAVKICCTHRFNSSNPFRYSVIRCLGCFSFPCPGFF